MSNFINSQNTNLLLDLVLDKGINNPEYINNIKIILSTSINEVINKYSINISNVLQYDAILNLNRETLVICKKKISMYELNKSSKSENLLSQTVNTNSDRNNQKIQFEDNLLKKQKDFDSYKVLPPKNISFKDDVNDKHIGDEMDDLIAKAIEMREKQLNQIFSDKPNISNNNIKKINIGEEIIINNNIIDLNNKIETKEKSQNNIFNSIEEINKEENNDLHNILNLFKPLNSEKNNNIDIEKYILIEKRINSLIDKTEELLLSLDDKINKLNYFLVNNTAEQKL